MEDKIKHKPYHFVIYALLTVISLIWLSPLAWLILSSLRLESGALTSYIMPKGYTLDNYKRLFTETSQFNYPRWYMNSFIVAIFSCLIATVFVLGVSFAFSRLKFTTKKLMMNLILILGMFPGFMSMIAIYHILKSIGLDGTLIALVLVYSGGAGLGYYIQKGFFDTIPVALDEAALLDGCTKFQLMYKIILPMSKPIITYTILTAFTAPWGDFIFASVIMKDNYQNYTLAVGLYRMTEREYLYQFFTRFCAGAVLIAIPITILFINMQKYYVSGVTGGAVKG
ncbi:MAG: sugar ABC transporter permease [Clostridiales bacterium]|jgi:arabinogalactan oligomer/maltooligosaccharide transport system permease protein|nr:sugar ABC transporter permease [Clostridiales bacterium]MDR2749086.1 sugar ABC transporter permease [Clostridiales bacterium]